MVNQELIRRTITGISYFLFCIISWYVLPPIGISLLLTIIWVYIFVQELPVLAARRFSLSWWFCLIYITVPFICCLWLNHNSFMRVQIAYIWLTAAVHDTAAYLVGRFIGKHLLFPRISPRKTVEGFLGGCAGVIVLFFWYARQSYVPFKHYTLFHLSIAAFVVSLIATAGDLVESYLKRRAGVKDTGFLLPGHGGLLDRIDSLLLLVPFWVFLLTFSI